MANKNTPQSEWWKRLSWSNCVRVTDSSEAKLCGSRFWNPVTPSCPGSRGGTHHKVSRMWEVIENSAGGAAGIEHRGSICSTKWFKHNTQGVRDTMLACDDSTKGAAGGKLSWTNWEIVHVSRRLGQGEKGRWGRRGLVTGGPGGFCEGAVVSLPTELHSGVSHCCLHTKMAPNASPCEIPC